MRAVFWAMVLLTLAPWHEVTRMLKIGHERGSVDDFILLEVIYFFAIFSVHYVGEFFKDDILTADLFKNMGEAMFTLSRPQIWILLMM